VLPKAEEEMRALQCAASLAQWSQRSDEAQENESPAMSAVATSGYCGWRTGRKTSNAYNSLQ
jgi:hypothetical protein